MFALMLTTSARAAEFEMVEYSAQVKLQWLAAAGIPEAQKFLKSHEDLNAVLIIEEDNKIKIIETGKIFR